MWKKSLFKKMSKVKHYQMGENSPNLVSLPPGQISAIFQISNILATLQPGLQIFLDTTYQNVKNIGNKCP
jgi:hypothetical protein